MEVLPAKSRDFSCGTLHAAFSSTAVLKSRPQNVGIPVVRMELKEMQKGIRRLADEVKDDRTKAQLESILERVIILDNAFAPDSDGKQSAFSDVG